MGSYIAVRDSITRLCHIGYLYRKQYKTIYKHIWIQITDKKFHATQSRKKALFHVFRISWTNPISLFNSVKAVSVKLATINLFTAAAHMSLVSMTSFKIPITILKL